VWQYFTLALPPHHVQAATTTTANGMKKLFSSLFSFFSLCENADKCLPACE
jgi:hypothetical protein